MPKRHCAIAGENTHAFGGGKEQVPGFNRPRLFDDRRRLHAIWFFGGDRTERKTTEAECQPYRKSTATDLAAEDLHHSPPPFAPANFIAGSKTPTPVLAADVRSLPRSHVKYRGQESGGLAGRVTSCAPQVIGRPPNGAHGVTRSTVRFTDRRKTLGGCALLRSKVRASLRRLLLFKPALRQARRGTARTQFNALQA